MGWIGIRCEKIGKASKILKREGWIKLIPAQVNNRMAFNWVRPVRTNDQFNATDWLSLANAGLIGIAIWICDAQWKVGGDITDRQWQNRAIIEADFNRQWPTGRRQ